jgi:hypothetical protein
LLGKGDLACFDCFRKTNFVVLSEEGVLTDVSEIEPDEVFFVAINPILSHPETSPFR